MKTLILAVVLGFALSACSPKSRMLMNPPSSAVDFAGGQNYSKAQAPEFNNKVDILFVIDNSSSMKTHIERLRKNIDKFVKAFETGSSREIDYRIGVTSVWDSYKFETRLQNRSGIKALRKPFKNGQLRPLKDAEGKYILSSVPYITPNTPDGIKILKNTLNIGIETHRCFKDKDGQKTDNNDKNAPDPLKATASELGDYLLTNCGPENEEIFAPIYQAVTNESLRVSENQNFPRKGLKQLVVIIISDAADDVRKNVNITAAQVKRAMRTFVPDEGSIKVFGAINTKCKRQAGVIDPGTIIDPTDFEGKKEIPIRSHATKVAELIKSTKGKELNICGGNYGTALAKFGTAIKTTVLEQQDVILHTDGIVEDKTLKLFYAKNNSEMTAENEIKLAQFGKRDGWYYISESKIGVPPESFEYDPAKKFLWAFTSVHPNDIRAGRTFRSENPTEDDEKDEAKDQEKD